MIESVCRRSLIEVKVIRGEDTRARLVTMIFDDGGTCIAEHDPVFPTPWYAPEESCARRRETAQ